MHCQCSYCFKKLLVVLYFHACPKKRVPEFRIAWLQLLDLEHLFIYIYICVFALVNEGVWCLLALKFFVFFLVHFYIRFIYATTLHLVFQWGSSAGTGLYDFLCNFFSSNCAQYPCVLFYFLVICHLFAVYLYEHIWVPFTIGFFPVYFWKCMFTWNGLWWKRNIVTLFAYFDSFTVMTIWRTFSMENFFQVKWQYHQMSCLRAQVFICWKLVKNIFHRSLIDKCYVSSDWGGKHILESLKALPEYCTDPLYSSRHGTYMAAAA